MQEQQRQLQAQLQRIGSVESKMESAVKQLQEAIADIKEVCPEELDVFENTVSELFSGETVAFLEPASDDDESVSGLDTELDAELDAEKEEDLEEDEEEESELGEEEDEDRYASELELLAANINVLRKLAKEWQMSAKGSKAAIIDRLYDIVTLRDLNEAIAANQ